MLIISAGMQKSGSAYLYNMINDLLSEAGNVDARDVKERYRLEKTMKWHNSNIGVLRPPKLLRLWKISRREGDFAVKTHQPPTVTARLMSRFDMVRFVYSYRDPRDVLLSARDHGRRILAEGEDHTFAPMVDFEVAVRRVQGWLKTWKRYNALDGVLLVRYEELVDEPVAVLDSIARHSGVSLATPQLQEITWRYSRNNERGERQGLHFNKARTERYVSEMTSREREICVKRFQPYLAQMGYPT